MKKINTALLACLMIAVIMLSGCGKDYSNSPYVGTWKGVSASTAGMELSIEEYFGSFILTFDAKGKASVEMNGETQSGKWDESENGVLVDKELNFVNDGGKLVYEQDNVTVTFEKQ
ncbi:MAG: hypothetical protein Q4B47_03025 [Eubacteriales bacterium]|nr:hypothetical protein [Eubacteriales bacterium]